MMDFGGKPTFGGNENDGIEENPSLIAQDGELPAAGSGQIIFQPGPDNVVLLPAGTSLDAITVRGNDLVVVLADGSVAIIPDGAIIVPQIVIDGVTVPAATLAALLNENVPEPAAGDPQSSGGNFSTDPGAIQDAYALGDLLPYTELQFPEPEEREIIPNEPDEEPEIVIATQDNPAGAISATATVDEEGLPSRIINGEGENAGTDPDSNVETTSGTIVFDVPDGVSSILINGVVVTEVGQTFPSPHGELEITGINFETGEITFTYTLTDNQIGNVSEENFEVTVIDTDGDTATATLTVEVIDDQPIARVDTDSIEAGNFGPATGSVLVNDESGADGYAVDGAVDSFSSSNGSAQPGDTLAGEYGELTLNADGGYSYVRFPNTPGGVSDEFTYTIIDGDGSTATATLTIDIGDAAAAITFVPETGDGTVVDEGQLPSTTSTRTDESEGSDYDGNSESTTGTITFLSPDGVASISLGGTTIQPGNLPQTVFTDATGTLVVTNFNFDPATGEGSITYVYTLTDNTGDTAGTEVPFEIIVTDLDGDTAEETVTITIIDDTPAAVNDSATQGSQNASVTIDVIDNDTAGADDVNLSTSVSAVTGSLTGDGMLIYNGDGTFTYTPAPGEEGTVTFDYTIVDGDGDPSTATVTINLATDSEPTGGVAVAAVDDDGLTGGNPASNVDDLDANAGDDPADFSEASFTGTLVFDVGADTPANISFDPALNGMAATIGLETVTYSVSGSTLTATGPRGVLFTVEITDSATGEYVVKLVDNVLHTGGPNEEATDAIASIALVVADSEGETASTTLTITFDDDAPTAADDAGGTLEEGADTTGFVLGNDAAGADDYAAIPISSITSVTTSASTTTVDGDGNYVLSTAYGTLTLNALTGAYSYEGNPNSTIANVQDSFTYTIVDADGDTSTATLTFDITNVAGNVENNNVIVDEAGLLTGSDPGSDGEFFTTGAIMATGGSGALTYTLTGANGDGDGVYGTLVLDPVTGTFTYTLDTPYTDGDTLENTTNTVTGAESFTYQVVDSIGNVVGTGVIRVDIIDDVPIAVDDPAQSIAEDASGTAAELSGNVMAYDTEGADGASVTSFR